MTVRESNGWEQTAGAPELNDSTAGFLLDLTEKDLEKIDVQHKHYVTIDLSDITEYDKAVVITKTRLGQGGQDLMPVITSKGMLLFDPDYLLPLKDIRDDLEWYERRTPSGELYLIAAAGWVPRAAIMPADVKRYKDLPDQLEAIAAGLRTSLADAEGTADSAQYRIDPDTGEVLE